MLYPYAYIFILMGFLAYMNTHPGQEEAGIGMFGSVLSIWGIGFVMWAIFIDMATILLTGISSIGCSILMYKEHLVSKRNAWLMGIGCFLFCIDILIAVIYLIKALIYKQIDS